jgi:ligand-binding sensor domain-containing protein/signal transduction histidine kinase
VKYELQAIINFDVLTTHINWKYFLPLLLLYGCKRNSNSSAEENLNLGPNPVVVSLNTSSGYLINTITGDSIKPLINTLGDTVKTGIPIPFHGKVLPPFKPRMVTAGNPTKTEVPTNVYAIPKNLTTFPVDIGKLTKIKLGQGDQSFVLKNSMGTLRTGVPIPITGRKVKCIEPRPVKALALRSKDNPTATIQYLDVGQGLNFSYISSILEDKRGNLWFGIAESGICKYDGKSFTNYTIKEGLTNNNVNCLFEDTNGNIWIGTEGGVTMFDGEGFTHYTEKEGLPNNSISAIHQDKRGSFWFSLPEGISKLSGKTITHYTNKEGLSKGAVFSSIDDRNGNIWIGTYFGAVKFDGYTFTYFNKKDGLASDFVELILEDSKGNMWFASNSGGISKYDGKKITRYSKKEGFSDSQISSILEDHIGNIWVGTYLGGAIKYDGKKFTHYTEREGLTKSGIRNMLEDKNGNIWLATQGGGVNKLSNKNFNHLIPNELFENSKIRPIVKDKNGNLWMGSDAGGIGKYDGKNFKYFTNKDGLRSISQRALLCDKKGNIWIGSDYGDIIEFDGNRFANYFIAERIPTSKVFSIFEDTSGNIWFGKKGGIIKFDGSIFTKYTDENGLSANTVFSIFQDKKGNFWFGTWGGGLSKYDGKQLIHYTEREGMFSTAITSIEEDEEGNIWLGTLGTGICKFDGSTFSYFMEPGGQLNNNIWSIQKDSLGNFWFGSDRGLTLFVPDSANLKSVPTKYNIHRFGLEDGLRALDFNLHSACIDDNNRIWWGTGKGVTSLDLNTKLAFNTPRSLGLSFIEINQQHYDFRNLPNSMRKNISYSHIGAFTNQPDGLKVSFDMNYFTFHFSAIEWSAPEKIKYSYRLIGLDDNWSKPDEESTADYRNLSYGNYEFQVKAIGESKLWTEPYTYLFTIQPAWWQTIWFKAILILLGAFLLFYISQLIVKARLRKQRTLMEKQLAVELERHRISSEMHDDIGAGLSGIRLLTEVAKRQSNDVQSLSELEKIYNSVGDLAERMREVIWSLNTENDHLESLIDFLRKQSHLVMEHYPCTFDIKMPEQIPDIKISGEARRHIYLAVKEALHNIIKHSGADYVELVISLNSKLVITIADNGKGIDLQNNNFSGNGLKNMRRRIEQLKGKFYINNTKGTLLTFEIPI